MRRILHRHPSALLLALQLASLLVYPMVDDTVAGRLLLGSVGVAGLLLAVWVVNRSPAVNWVVWTLALPAIAFIVAALVFARPELLVVSWALESLVYFYAAGSLILYMMSDHRVTADELFAAGATFTLLAWGFAYAYSVCQALVPGSFVAYLAPNEPRSWMELLFLSFTSLSGVGLGDVVPITAPARVLVMLEEFAGVAYIATVVSRLVGLTIVRETRR